MALTCGELLQMPGWTEAIQHEFLTSCKEGTITPSQFNTWLLQDYKYVQTFARCIAATIAAAPNSHLVTLLSGAGAISSELAWFQAKAVERSLDFEGAPIQPACQKYVEFMKTLQANPSYPVQAAMLWAIEWVYNHAWRGHMPMVPLYAEFADRWGNDGFCQYVKQLEQQADQALAAASAEEQEEVRRLVAQMLAMEQDFWSMAYSNTQ